MLQRTKTKRGTTAGIAICLSNLIRVKEWEIYGFCGRIQSNCIYRWCLAMGQNTFL